MMSIGADSVTSVFASKLNINENLSEATIPVVISPVSSDSKPSKRVISSASLTSGMSVPTLNNTTKSIISSANSQDTISNITLMGSTAVKNSNITRSTLSSHSSRDYNQHVESLSTPLLLCNDSNGQIASNSIDSRQQQEPLSIASLASSLVNDNICHSPTQILNDMIANNTNQTVAEDPRTLQLALELSMVGLNEPLSSLSATSAQLQTMQHSNQNYQQLSQLRSNQIMPSDQQSNDFDINTLNVISAAVAAAAASVTGTHTNNLFNNSVSNIVSLNHFVNSNNSNSCFAPNLEDRSKKSQNMTECVPVPSSEHVAEIVGRQGIYKFQ
ncbi:putative uncharacterized protein DDB_G0277255 [Teleopsis dalmanni]|uniref:putative uncharacterized protein DDB_G0277255 n=1 Tax=Teleopsis dalmanni TaxID=139649 RepID=UPI0018CD3429|nr:putative uncharacterized protein DDB_G0277255 [Teleopsis dalmanni]XP_037955377.1 putative uncharacterized protein DDB_G0277255 [Teleopsis dalmanni]XP_037955378.1 putative uncharacterized protein DDB_G0277255 [Teleopsis dalmanni]